MDSLTLNQVLPYLYGFGTFFATGLGIIFYIKRMFKMNNDKIKNEGIKENQVATNTKDIERIKDIAISKDEAEANFKRLEDKIDFIHKDLKSDLGKLQELINQLLLNLNK